MKYRNQKTPFKKIEACFLSSIFSLSLSDLPATFDLRSHFYEMRMQAQLIIKKYFYFMELRTHAT